jgi:hypothetical protein
MEPQRDKLSPGRRPAGRKCLKNRGFLIARALGHFVPVALRSADAALLAPAGENRVFRPK